MTRWPKPTDAKSAQAFNELSVPGGLLPPRKVRESPRDVAYADGPRRRLDIYRPPGGGGRAPLIVFLYGGSWRTGSKEDYPFVALPLAARGAVVVVPENRLYPEVVFPAFLNDSARAVAWAVAHAPELGTDPSRVFRRRLQCSDARA